MNSGMIGKIDKAHRYAEEPERLQMDSFQARFRGSHDDYVVSYDGQKWHCSCHTFEAHVLDSCSHVMAAQLILGPMLNADARYASTEHAVPV